ncbi:TetR/AcrR family transcriptional regulator [Cesiribacter sp. SM1]|uniref:TetR/AcrR family transcriptional regulator n=1 Tax=Cesiribacter sp. SM1 TaxID=2861196 RepID=UPI001CD23FD3|nr:TetR/AcrR family transcriptional regulator [Cesiribacter sp. SM1]
MRNPEVTRDTILQEAGALFNTHGYKATSISHITDATGFTKGAIYRHFRSKEELEKETLHYLSSVMFGKVGAVIRAQPTAGAKLRALIGFFESYVNNPPLKGGCPLLNVAIEADDAHPPLREEANRILSTLKNSLVHILTRGIEFKQIREDVDKEFYATIFIASLEGAIMMSKLRGNNEDMKKVIRHLEQQISAIEL